MIFHRTLNRVRPYLLLIIILAVSILNFGMTAHLEKRLAETFELQRHAHDVRDISARLLINLVDAETGQRGYILTDKLEYLEPYHSGIVRTNSHVQKLRELTQHEPHLYTHFTVTEDLINQKLAELSFTIELSKAEKKKDALEIIVSGLGKQLMDQIRLELENIDQALRETLSDSNAAVKSLQSLVWYVFIVETLIFACVILVLIYIASRSIFKPLKMLTESVRKFSLEGKFTPLKISSFDELVELAEAFKLMGTTVSQKASNIEKHLHQIQTEKDKAYLESVTDPLTGLANRRFMAANLSRHFLAAKRYGYDLNVIMLDVDHFKKINDTFGHTTGDIVLKAISKILKDEIRLSDFVIRYGGEEFLLVLSQTPIDNALVKAEKIRLMVSELNLDEVKRRRVTVSLGIAQITETDESIENIILRADEALYKAKNDGRNCIKTA